MLSQEKTFCDEMVKDLYFLFQQKFRVQIDLEKIVTGWCVVGSPGGVEFSKLIDDLLHIK